MDYVIVVRRINPGRRAHLGFRMTVRIEMMRYGESDYGETISDGGLQQKG